MQKLLVFSLSVLVIIAFLGGINLGKKIQVIDTPERTVIKKVTVFITEAPTLTPSPTKKISTPSATLTLSPTGR